jgi:hypothetical protein
MNKIAAVVLAAAYAGCAPIHRVADMRELVLLSGGCANTETMRANLDDALMKMGLAMNYQVVDAARLAPSDARIGYPTPTLLYRDRDLFGLPVPTPPFPQPS